MYGVQFIPAAHIKHRIPFYRGHTLCLKAQSYTTGIDKALSPSFGAKIGKAGTLNYFSQSTYRSTSSIK